MLMITTPTYLSNFGGFILQLISNKIIVSLFYYWRIKTLEVPSLDSYINSPYSKVSNKVCSNA